jgi:SPP1 gp7 family putative phage head morphogenesis protein
MYAAKIREALAGAIDTAKLAGAWQALHPGSVTKAIGPAVRAFLDRALAAIVNALRAVLGRLRTEGHVLGQQAAEAVVAGLDEVDWDEWTPGDYAAAEAVAGDGLQQLLDAADITIRSIAQSRVGELAAVLEATLASDVTSISPEGPLPPRLSVGDLARQLQQVLDNPANAEMVAWSEIARAQSAAAMSVYRQAGTERVEWSTAEDARVCPACDADEAAGPVPLGQPFPSGHTMPPGHPNCRCALLPVLAGAA